MAGLVRVGGFASRNLAELALTYLNANGIDAIVLADDAGGAYPHVPLGAGGIALGVRADDADAARELLAEAAARPVEDGSDSGASVGRVPPTTKWILRLAAAAVAAVLAFAALPRL